MNKCIICDRNIPFDNEIFCSFGCRNEAESEEILHDRVHKDLGVGRAAKTVERKMKTHPHGNPLSNEGFYITPKKDESHELSQEEHDKDIAYFRKILYEAIKVPKKFLKESE